MVIDRPTQRFLANREAILDYWIQEMRFRDRLPVHVWNDAMWRLTQERRRVRNLINAHPGGHAHAWSGPFGLGVYADW